MRPPVLQLVEKEIMISLFRLATQDVDLVKEMRDCVGRMPWEDLKRIDDSESFWFQVRVAEANSESESAGESEARDKRRSGESPRDNDDSMMESNSEVPVGQPSRDTYDEHGNVEDGDDRYSGESPRDIDDDMMESEVGQLSRLGDTPQHNDKDVKNMEVGDTPREKLENEGRNIEDGISPGEDDDENTEDSDKNEDATFVPSKIAPRLPYGGSSQKSLGKRPQAQEPAPEAKDTKNEDRLGDRRLRPRKSVNLLGPGKSEKVLGKRKEVPLTDSDVPTGKKSKGVNTRSPGRLINEPIAEANFDIDTASEPQLRAALKSQNQRYDELTTCYNNYVLEITEVHAMEVTKI